MERATSNKRPREESGEASTSQLAPAGATLRAIDPLEFYREHIKRGVRPDGRALMKGRKASVHESNITTCDGSALVRIGRTAVLAGVRSEPTEPAPAEGESARGRIIVSLELPAICSAAASAAALGGDGGRGKNEREQAVLLELLQRTAMGGLVELDSLCIIDKVAVWSMYRRREWSPRRAFLAPSEPWLPWDARRYCDLYVLEDDGNLTDAAILAMSSALSRVRLHRVVADESDGVLTVQEEHAVPVVLGAPLYPVTFGVLCEELLVDPCAEEEPLLSSSCTLLLDAAGELRAVHKPGGAPLPDGALPACVAAARQRLPALAAVVPPAAPPPMAESIMDASDD